MRVDALADVPQRVGELASEVLFLFGQGAGVFEQVLKFLRVKCAGGVFFGLERGDFFFDKGFDVLSAGALVAGLWCVGGLHVLVPVGEEPVALGGEFFLGAVVGFLVFVELVQQVGGLEGQGDLPLFLALGQVAGPKVFPGDLPEDAALGGHKAVEVALLFELCPEVELLRLQLIGEDKGFELLFDLFFVAGKEFLGNGGGQGFDPGVADGDG